MAITIDEGFISKAIYQDIYQLEDKAYSLDDVLNQGANQWKIVSLKKDIFKKYQSIPTWLKIEITNQNLGQNNWIIYPTGYVKQIEMYVFDEQMNQLSKSTTGLNGKITNDALATGRYGIKIHIPYKQKRHIYIKYQPYYSTQLEMIITNTQEYYKLSTIAETFWGFYFGSIFVLIIYSLTSYITSKDTSYLYYSIFSIFMTLYIFSKFSPFKAYNQSFIHIDLSSHLGTFSNLLIIMGLAFVREFLEINKTKSHSNTFLVSSMIVFLLATISTLFLPQKTTLMYIKPLTTFIAIAMLYSPIVSAFKGYRPGLYLTLALISLTIGTIISHINDISPFVPSHLEEFIIPFFSFIELILISGALTSRLSHLRNKLLTKYRTHEKQLQKEVEVKTEQLLSNEKFVALGRIAKGISHEINNPLMIIRGNVERIHKILDRTNQSPKISEKLIRIQSANERIAIIVRAFLTLSQTDKGSYREKVHLKNIIDEAVSFSKTKFENLSIEIILHNNVTDDLVNINQKEIFSVLITLINNSIDAISENHEKKWIKISLFDKVKKSGSILYIEIIDSGLTPDKTTCSKMFEPFFNTKEQGKTLGLSLPLAKKVIQNHDGKIVCETENVNTTFLIKLPKSA